MTSPLPSHELRVAIEAAKAGAQKALEYYDQGIETTLKADKTVVTKADLESERVIKEVISKEFPDAKFLAEEGGGQIHDDAFWIIDPIDGTRSFSRGIPTWNVLIAYCQNKKVKVGVSYFPVLNGLVYAETGKGAFYNDVQIHVSNVTSLDKAYTGMGSPRYFKDKQIILDLIEASSSLRIHDLTFTTFLLAQGKMDALVDAYGKTWDNAPWKVIIEEAGGRITRLNGDELELDGREGSVISNGILHDEVLAITKKYY